MKNFVIMLAMLLFASNLVPAPAADLDRTSFNLVKVNKGDFMLCEKLPENTPPPPKIEEIPKVESPKKVDGPKIEPRPMPNGRVEETPAPQTNPVYTDGSGNIRRRSEDGNDWYWSPNNGGFWWRSASGPVQQGIPRMIMPAPQTFQQPQYTPYCPSCQPGR